MFIIVSNQRTGSNLLMDLLNSHPDLTCLGEILLESEKHPKDTLYKLKEKQGCLIKYSQMAKPHIAPLVEEPDFSKLNNLKVIHLKRNIRDTAISQWISEHNNIKHSSTKRQKFDLMPNENQIEGHIKRATGFEERAKSVLDSFENVFEIHYEDICDNKELQVWKKENNKELLKFLNVKAQDLKTKLKKINNK